MKPDIIVVTAAYGHAQIAALGGQRALLPIIQQAGADGVEIRQLPISKVMLIGRSASLTAVKNATDGASRPCSVWSFSTVS